MLDRQKEIYDRYPLKVTLDGGFASKVNLEKPKNEKSKMFVLPKNVALKKLRCVVVNTSIKNCDSSEPVLNLVFPG